MTLIRHAWITCAAVLILACALVALLLPRSPELIAFGDLTPLFLMCGATAVMAANAFASRGQTRGFWALIAASCFLWTCTQALWTYWEVILRQQIPEPFVGDVILFIHVVPLMAAVALRPHRLQEEQTLYFSTLNFLMLLLWWVCLRGSLQMARQKTWASTGLSFRRAV